MKLVEIIQDSLRYPFSDWKNLLIFGIFVLLSDLRNFSPTTIQNNAMVNLIYIIGNLFLVGYIFWNIRCSLDGEAELPKLKDLVQIVIDGIKVFVVLFIYSIPVFLLLILGLEVYSESSIITVSLLYPLIIAPLFAFSIAHMANNDGKLGSAFRFLEIIAKIESVGWIKLLLWYLTAVIIFVILMVIVLLISEYISDFVGIILGLVLMSIFYPYISRSLALLYRSGTTNTMMNEIKG